MTWFALYGSPVSDSYHQEGSVVVWAKDEDDAKAIATDWSLQNVDQDYSYDGPVWHSVRKLDRQQVHAFPDSGCC